MAMNPKDRFGYYSVGAWRTYSKLEALEAMRRTNIHVEWHFEDQGWSQVDWLNEPIASLSDLYAQRAWQIRRKYDHVVLMYSGGIDSQNILDTFVVNNIPIDEVATQNYNTADPRPMSYFHGEQTLISYPYLQSLRDRGVRFLHRSLDLSDIVNGLMDDPEIADNYTYLNNVGWGWNRLAKSMLRDRCQDWRRIMDSGRSLALVWGTDKPRIYLQDGKLCVKFIDLVIDTVVTPWTQIQGREQEHDELFYWSTDLPEIVVKQSHIIKRFVREHDLVSCMHDAGDGIQYINVNDLEPVLELKKAWGHENDMSWRDTVCRLIYPYFDQTAFNHGKRGSAIFSEKDAVWLADPRFYKDLVQRLRYLDTVDPYWKNDPADIFMGIKGCITKPYWIEPPI